MILLFNKQFKKIYKKLSANEQKKCDERLLLFMQDPHHTILNNHALNGRRKQYRSINMTGDIRALYEPISASEAHFIDLDTHSNLY